MAVKLRLARLGKKSFPVYRIIAVDEHKKRGGKYIEIVGHYDPSKEANGVTLKDDRIKYWLSVGAKPTHTVGTFIRKFLKK